MADNDLNNPSFGIEDTLEMGAGNTELIDKFLSSDSATANPDELKPIIKEVDDEKKVAKEKSEKPKEGEEEKKPLSGNELISTLLDEEEEKEEEDKEKKEEKPPEETEVVEETSTFSALSKDLVKLGVFTTEEGEEEPEIKTPQEFLDRFHEEKKKGAIQIVNNFIGQFGDDYQRAFDAIYVKGVDPREYFGAYNNIVNFAELDLEKEENQIAVVQKALSEQGMEPDDITTEVERLKNYGDLATVAAKHHKVLVKKEAARLQQLEAQAEQDMQQKLVFRNQYIQNVQSILQEKLKTKEFDGIPLNPKLVGELQEFLLVDKWKTSSGETLTEFDHYILELKKPENHAMKVKLALLLKVLEKDPTLSTIQKAGVTKQTDQLFETVRKQQGKSKVADNAQNKQNSWFL